MINDGFRDFSIEVVGKIKRRWELRDGETVLFSASKKFGLKRIVKIEADGQVYTLFRQPGSDAMILEGPSTSACYQRVHFMTRRQKITGQWADDRLVIFGFWFVAYYDQIDSVIGEVISVMVEMAP
ncbi:MAG: hypothetical protein JNK37_15415 [Verrucomicrobiales bacterium]|nr:hypothetical protein [Verrucomicrobiales bacterium]